MFSLPPGVFELTSRVGCLWKKNCFEITESFVAILQADSEHLDYDFRADAEYPSPEDSLIHSVVNAAQVKNSSSFMVSATHLAGNTAQGAGGGIFATSQAGVYLLCGSSNLADTGQSTPDFLQLCQLSIGCDLTMSLADPEALEPISLLLMAFGQPNPRPLGNLSSADTLPVQLMHPPSPQTHPHPPSSCASAFAQEVQTAVCYMHGSTFCHF